ncbi:MAG: FAD:protein FMN transferase [Phycisphaerales bacterium]|nr:FAD:protein FMN transferase [Phycisphaerales bacterium]
MGSRCSIVLFAESEEIAANAADHAFDAISDVNRALSDYQPSSESMRSTSRNHNQWISITPLFTQVLVRSKEMFKHSNGAFDPTVGAYTHLWRTAIKENRVPTEDEIRHASELVGFRNVHLDAIGNRVMFKHASMILDFGAIGKGFAADRAMRVLQTHGIRSALVNIGGDIVIGDPPPDFPDGWLISVQVIDGEQWSSRMHSVAIATSGDSERYFISDGVRYSHIIDPRTGYGVQNQNTVTVIASNGSTADAVASVVAVLGAQIVPKFKAQYTDLKVFVDSGQSQ